MVRGIKVDKQQKKALIFFLLLLLFYLIYRQYTLIFIFIAISVIAKIIRVKKGLDFLMFDPMMFLCILIYFEWRFSMFAIFTVVTVIVADAISGNFDEGTFINLILFLVTPVVAGLIFLHSSLVVFSLAATLLYAALYIPLRLLVFNVDPFTTYSKAISNIVVVYLYAIILGPFVSIIMG
jgi:hypothetical protein